MELVHEINRILTEKEERLAGKGEEKQNRNLVDEQIKLLDEESNKRLEQIAPESKRDPRQQGAA